MTPEQFTQLLEAIREVNHTIDINGTILFMALVALVFCARK